MRKTLYYSYRVEEEKIVDFKRDSEYEIIFGKAHYSYKIAAKKFLNLLRKNAYVLNEIIRPEMYKHSKSFEHINDFSLAGDNIHFIFKPIEHINPLKKSKNIGVFAWEFDKINEDNIGENPFLNQKNMLNLLDEIWVPSSYTKEVLENYGFSNVYFIPAPIQEPSELYDIPLKDLVGDMLSMKLHSSSINSEKIMPLKENIDLSVIKKTYFAILNPWDYRKNLPGLLKTFIHFSNKHKDVLFIIKVIIDNKTTFLSNINEILYIDLKQHELKSDNILFISEYIPEKLLYSIMKKVDFYYNLSYAEGQFLPILESMILGTVPISPDSTAMKDYIEKNNALVVKSTSVLADPKSNAFKKDDFRWFEPNLNDAIKQLKKSYYITEKEYNHKAQRAILKVKEVYGEKIIIRKIKERIDG